MSPTRRREVLHRIREDHPGLSERHACRLVGLCRGAVNEPFRRIDKDKPLVSMLMRLVQERLLRRATRTPRRISRPVTRCLSASGQDWRHSLTEQSRRQRGDWVANSCLQESARSQARGAVAVARTGRRSNQTMRTRSTVRAVGVRPSLQTLVKATNSLYQRTAGGPGLHLVATAIMSTGIPENQCTGPAVLGPTAD